MWKIHILSQTNSNEQAKVTDPERQDAAHVLPVTEAWMYLTTWVHQHAKLAGRHGYTMMVLKAKLHFVSQL